MKTTGIITAIVLLTMGAMADDHAKHEMTQAMKDCMPCATPDGVVQACGQEWLDIDTLTIEAANGDPIAQYTIAYLTDDGSDMPAKDCAETSASMYKAALPKLHAEAKAGNGAACLALAHMYHTGSGVEKNPEMAKKFIAMAHAAKDKPACCGECKK